MMEKSEIEKKENSVEKEGRPSRNGKLKFPRVCIAVYICAGISAAVYTAACLSESFADFFCRYIASAVRAVLAFLTSWIPFSLGEAVLILLPVLAGFFIYYSNKISGGSWKDVFVSCGAAFSAVALVWTLFVFTLGTGYRGSSVDRKLGLERRDCSAEELCATAKILKDIINGCEDDVYAREGGFSVMPYDYGRMSDKLVDAYRDLSGKYGFIQKLDSRVKTVMLSEPWTYTHITGVYTFFTGESNLNVNMPDYTLPFTAAHEFAHQRGVAREDEANFIAYIACINSDDPYIKYSGALSMYEYVTNALYSADYDLFIEARSGLCQTALNDMYSYNRFFEKYRTNTVAKVSGKVNDTYLKSQGQAGSVSYGLVVDLAVAYHRPDFQVPAGVDN